MLTRQWVCLLILLVTLVCAGCSARDVGMPNRAVSADFTLNILPESYYGGAAECAWETGVELTESGCIVRVKTTGADSQKALYFDLGYDAETMHPVAAEPVGSALECELLNVSILDDRGTVHFGMILPNPDQKAGFSGDGVLAQVEFKYGAAEENRRVSGVPTDHYSSAELRNWNSPSLVWYSTFSGDCNQDGIVTVTDLTPIGVNYGIAFTPENFWMDGSLLYAVDTDRNFEITVADITAIGRNFGKDVLGGFNVYQSTDYLDFPSSNDEPNGPGAALIGNVAFKGADPQKKYKLGYSFEVTSPDESSYYWIRPVDSSGNTGTPSRMITQIGLNTSREDAGAAELLWDDENSNLVWGYNFPGDYNQDGLVTLFDLTLVGVHYRKQGPFAIDSTEALVDSNHDQIISVRDFYNVAVHFDKPFNGYRVFRSDDPTDYPLYNDSQPTIDPFTDHTYVSSEYEGPRDIWVRHIETPGSGMYYWVRLVDQNGLCGTPSNMIQIP